MSDAGCMAYGSGGRALRWKGPWPETRADDSRSTALERPWRPGDANGKHVDDRCFAE